MCLNIVCYMGIKIINNMRPVFYWIKNFTKMKTRMLEKKTIRPAELLLCTISLKSEDTVTMIVTMITYITDLQSSSVWQLSKPPPWPPSPSLEPRGASTLQASSAHLFLQTSHQGELLTWSGLLLGQTVLLELLLQQPLFHLCSKTRLVRPSCPPA